MEDSALKHHGIKGQRWGSGGIRMRTVLLHQKGLNGIRSF